MISKQADHDLSKLRKLVLTHFKSMFQFYTPLKHQKTSRFLTFSGGIEIEHDLNWLNDNKVLSQCQ